MLVTHRDLRVNILDSGSRGLLWRHSGVIVLCSWARHYFHGVSPSTQEYKWVLDKHPILWEKQCLELLHATESRMIKRWLNELLGSSADCTVNEYSSKNYVETH